jgi:integrase/recombinase XerD
MDTGMRLDEALNLRTPDVDFENLLITIRKAKGGKQRVVPFSTSLRKVLFKYVAASGGGGGLVFSTRDGGPLLQNNVRRDFTRLCKRIGIAGRGVKGGFHILRHGFATEYLRRGGDVIRLGRILGHSTLEVTRRYVHLQTEDLSAVHERLSLLNTGK